MRLEAIGADPSIGVAARALDEMSGVRGVRVVGAVRDGQSVLAADLRPAAVDPALDKLRGLGVEDSAITVTRLEAVDWAARSSDSGSELVWADVMGQAWINSRPLPRYLALMVVAGVIAFYGVVDTNVILIVGAMAVSPDLLPISAIGVALVGRSFRLAVAAALTMAVGLATTGATAALLSFVENNLAALPEGFSLPQAASALGGLTSVDSETILVAFAAGAAGMLALETRASSAVGVAVSVTTIPAAAYLGVAAGLGELTEAVGAVGVLAMNVTMMALGASLTLLVQRRLRIRAAQRRERAQGDGTPTTV